MHTLTNAFHTLARVLLLMAAIVTMATLPVAAGGSVDPDDTPAPKASTSQPQGKSKAAPPSAPAAPKAKTTGGNTKKE